MVTMLSQHLDKKMKEIKWRFSKLQNDNYSETLDIISEQIDEPEDPSLIWLAYRLMEAESKRISVEQKVESLLPKLNFGV